MPVHRHKDRKRKRHLYYYEFQFLGERRKKSGFLTRDEAGRAELAEKEKIQRIQNGEYELDEDFNTYIKAWLDRRRDLGENTMAIYQVMLRNHILPFFKGYKVNTVKSADMNNFMEHLYEKNLSGSGVRKNYNLINKMFNELKSLEMLQSNPCDPIAKPKETSAKIEVFDVDELQEFLGFAEGYTRYAFGFRLAAYTGMRRGELLALNWNNVDLKRRIIRVRKRVVKAAKGTDRYIQGGTKTSDGRNIAIPPSLVPAISNHHEIQQMERERNKYDDNNLVIATRNGRIVCPDNFTRIFRNTLKASKIDKKLSLHGLRHTHATLLLKKNVQMKIVSERLGHSGISITMDTYSHLLPNMDHNAMDKFDELFD